MLKQFLMTYGERKLFGFKEKFDTVWAHQARTAVKQFYKRYPRAVVYDIYVKYKEVKKNGN